MKRRGTVWALLLVLLLTMTACGSAGGDSAGTAAQAETAYDSGWNGEPAAAADTAAAENGAAVSRNAKLILRAELSLETEDFAETTAAIDKLRDTVGGYYESNGTGGEIGARYADYVVRVPQEKFETFLAGIGESCHVVDKRQYADDIAEQYADLETRLATQQTKHERLLALLDQAGKMEDIIALETALAETEYEIDSLTGQKRSYDSLVDYSTINLSLREVQSLTAVTETASFGSQVKRAARSGLGGLGGFLRGLILLMVTIWPLLLIVAAVLAVLTALRRRRRAKEAAEAAKSEAERQLSNDSKDSRDGP